MDSIHPSYFSDTLNLAYSNIIPPIQLQRVGEDETDVVCLAPIVRRGKGRPKTKRGTAGPYRQTNRKRKKIFDSSVVACCCDDKNSRIMGLI
jgi:hypothetical protein